jgi:hypothetical protein
MRGKYNVRKRVSRGRTLVASADEAWVIRGLEGTGGEVRRGRVLLDKGRGMLQTLRLKEIASVGASVRE